MELASFSVEDGIDRQRGWCALMRTYKCTNALSWNIKEKDS
jgi:hypothetical protein